MNTPFKNNYDSKDSLLYLIDSLIKIYLSTQNDTFDVDLSDFYSLLVDSLNDKELFVLDQQIMNSLLNENHIVDDALDKERLKLTYTFYRDILNNIDATPWFEIIKWTMELKKKIKHLENNLKIE